MTTEIDRIIQKTRRYWYDDGFMEMARGVLFLAVAGLVWAQWLIPAGSFWFTILSIGLPLAIIGGFKLAQNFVTTLKQRVTFPRTGYVALQGETHHNSRWIIAATAFAVAVVVVAGGRWPNSLPLFAGLLLAAAFVTIGGRLGAPRFYILAVIAALLGTGVAMTGLSEGPGLAALLGGLGLGELIIGSVVLLRYFGQKPPLQQA